MDLGDSRATAVEAAGPRGSGSRSPDLAEYSVVHSALLAHLCHFSVAHPAATYHQTRRGPLRSYVAAGWTLGPRLCSASPPPVLQKLRAADCVATSCCSRVRAVHSNVPVSGG